MSQHLTTALESEDNIEEIYDDDDGIVVSSMSGKGEDKWEAYESIVYCCWYAFEFGTVAPPLEDI